MSRLHFCDQTRPNTTRLDQHVFCDGRQKQVARVKGLTMTSGHWISIKRDKNKSLDYTQTCRSRGTTKGVLGTINHSIGLREFLFANMIDRLIDWVRLNVPPTHYRSYADGFLRVKWPNQQCQSTEGTHISKLKTPQCILTKEYR